MAKGSVGKNGHKRKIKKHKLKKLRKIKRGAKRNPNKTKKRIRPNKSLFGM